MNTPFFSIIIPVYNGLSHDLPICLNSIWEQPLDKELYEVICVDDCSTDDTRSWLKQQAQEHNNLHIIENEQNIRQGGARNKGVKAAKGEYILFIDQDDYYHKNSIKLIYEHIINTELDIFVSDSAFQFKGYETNKLQLNLPNKEILTGEEFLIKNGPALAPWRLCLKKEFVFKHNLWFVENCRIEDIDWACKVIFYAKKIQYLPILLVHYIKGEKGQTDTMYKNPEILKANTIAGNRTLEIAETLYKNSIAQNVIFNIVQQYYNYTCRYLFGIFLPIKEKTNIIKLIQIKQSKHRLVNYAISYPFIFSIISNLAVPVFRALRYFRRLKKAKELKG